MSRQAPTHPKARKVKTCGGKRRYRDHAEAVLALHNFAAHSTREKIPVRAYACTRCGGWHTTSQD